MRVTWNKRWAETQEEMLVLPQLDTCVSLTELSVLDIVAVYKLLRPLDCFFIVVPPSLYGRL
jgi:hypothetical protein